MRRTVGGLLLAAVIAMPVVIDDPGSWPGRALREQRRGRLSQRAARRPGRHRQRRPARPVHGDGSAARALGRPAAALHRPALRLPHADARPASTTTSRTRRSGSRATTSPRPSRRGWGSRSSATSRSASRTSTATRARTSCSAPATRAPQDRLFLMDILRHTGRAQLSSFAGGSAGNRAMDAHAVDDRALHRGRPPEAGRQRAAGSTAPPASRSSPTSATSSPGSTPTSTRRCSTRPSCPPNTPPSARCRQHWSATDVIAVASLVGGIFGKGGGNELGSALTLAGVRSSGSGSRPGAAHGRTSAPRTIRRRRRPSARAFSYEQTSPFASKGLALPDPGSVELPAVSESGSSGAMPPIQIPADGSIGSQLLRNFYAEPAHASNWLLIPARNSATGHSIGVLGPQVGYYVPADPDGGGPARPGHRRARGGVPGRQPLRAARARARLRVERDDGDLRQRRHVRRGALRRRLPLPVQGPVPGDGEARADQQLDAQRRSTRPRPAPRR